MVDIPPLMLTAMRFALISVPFVWFFPFPKTSVLNVFLVGFFLQLLSAVLVNLAMREDAQAGIASLMVQSQVIFTLIFSSIIFSEKVSRQQLIGLLIAIVGFAIFFVHIDRGGSTTITGFALLIGSGMSWAVANLILKQMKDVNILHVMIWASLVPPIPLFILSYFLEARRPVAVLLGASMETWGAILYLSFCVGLLAFIWWGDLIRRYSSSYVVPFGLLVPVFGLMGSWLLLGESIDALEWVASLLVFLGIGLCAIQVKAFETGGNE
ncbi:EamA family transporter [Microbulbifer sp. OS29]|uniref:EamA family transporter n=2 Tax=Microbulbifer okhotskensis TaxID=2926617 RepID=A0A9X2J8N4_9GAMM|nr:EamA family transporter [Microbulbifer okhotskensis]